MSKIEINKVRYTPPMGTKYPFAEMEVGDSFDVDPMKGQSAQISGNCYAKRRGYNWKFTCKVIDKITARVWRVM